jgi:hypothetical protein
LVVAAIITANPPEVRVGWFADALPGTAGTPEAQCLTTARLTGSDVFDSAGRMVRDSSVTSGSGTRSDANGPARRFRNRVR